MEEMRLTQAAAAGVGLQPPPAGQPGAVDLLGENGLGPWVRRLTILAGEIDDISLHLNRWCDIYPERLRYVRESLPRTSGRERQQLQEDLAVIQADIRDSETYLRQHGVSATRASCEARPPEPARH